MSYLVCCVTKQYLSMGALQDINVDFSVKGNALLNISCTLGDLIEMSGPDDYLFNLYEESMQACEAGQIIGDWEHGSGINNLSVMFGEPAAPKGYVRIWNDYSEYSDADCDYNDTGKDQSQIFTFAQFRFAIKTWNEFRAMVKRDGIEAWEGKRYEVPFPEPV